MSHNGLNWCFVGYNNHNFVELVTYIVVNMFDLMNCQMIVLNERFLLICTYHQWLDTIELLLWFLVNDSIHHYSMDIVGLQTISNKQKKTPS